MVSSNSKFLSKAFLSTLNFLSFMKDNNNKKAEITITRRPTSSVTNKPSSQESVSVQPSSEVTNQPSSAQPVSVQPSSFQPSSEVTNQPVSAQPVSLQPSLAQPSSFQPSSETTSQSPSVQPSISDLIPTNSISNYPSLSSKPSFRSEYPSYSFNNTSFPSYYPTNSSTNSSSILPGATNDNFFKKTENVVGVTLGGTFFLMLAAVGYFFRKNIVARTKFFFPNAGKENPAGQLDENSDGSVNSESEEAGKGKKVISSSSFDLLEEENDLEDNILEEDYQRRDSLESRRTTKPFAANSSFKYYSQIDLLSNENSAFTSNDNIAFSRVEDDFTQSISEENPSTSPITTTPTPAAIQSLASSSRDLLSGGMQVKSAKRG